MCHINIILQIKSKAFPIFFWMTILFFLKANFKNTKKFNKILEHNSCFIQKVTWQP